MRSSVLALSVVFGFAASACSSSSPPDLGNGSDAGGSGNNPQGDDDGNGAIDGSVSSPGDDAGGGKGDDGGTVNPGADASPGTDGAPPPHGTLCTVTPGTKGYLLRGTVLAPGAVLSPGEVLVGADGMLACVDQTCGTAAGASDATVIDCPNGVISPALINTHDHIDYSGTPPVAHGTERYDHRNDWRDGYNGHAALNPYPVVTNDQNVVYGAELRFVMGGATGTVSSGGVAGMLRNYANASQLEGLTLKAAKFDTFPLGDGSRSSPVEIASGCAYPKTPTPAAEFTGGSYFPHIAEGVNAAAENELTCMSADKVVTAQTSIIHAAGINAKDAQSIKDNGARVVWSPRTNVDLYGNTAPVTILKKLGVPISLGTDWLPSGSMNMLRELQCADALNQKYYAKAFSDEELWQMATINAAAAVGAGGQVGSLAKGLVGDIAIFNGTTNKAHRAVIGASAPDVVLVLRGGKALYGDDAVVAGAGGSTCETLDVCGVPKRACVSVDTAGARTLSAVTTALTNVYPLFYCGAPAKEPSCVPYRDTYPNGTSATDRDGDGVLDAQDMCPDVFDPPRPMDGATQSDVDGDGKGDACDKCPLDKNDGC